MEQKQMTVIEALKRLRVIEKRMQGNCQDITRYASAISTEKAAFETETKQREEVKGLTQSNEDLLQEYLNLKTRIEKTNLNVQVKVAGKDYSIAELLVIRRKMADNMQSTYSSLNTSVGDMRVRRVPGVQGVAQPHVVTFYDEADKNSNLRKWMDIKDQIDGKLEVVNATTQLSK